MCPCQATSRRKKDGTAFSCVAKDHTTTDRNTGIYCVYSYLWQILVNMRKNSASFDIHTIEIIILHVLTTIANIDMIVSVANENDL